MRFITWLTKNTWFFAGLGFLILSFFPNAPDHYPYVAIGLFAFQALLDAVRDLQPRVQPAIKVNHNASIRDELRNYDRGDARNSGPR